MNKIYRIKSQQGMVSVALAEIQAVRTTFDEGASVEIILRGGAILDAPMTPDELEALLKVWNDLL